MALKEQVYSVTRGHSCVAGVSQYLNDSFTELLGQARNQNVTTFINCAYYKVY